MGKRLDERLTLRWQRKFAQASLIFFVTFGGTLYLGAPKLAVIPLFGFTIAATGFLLATFVEEATKP